MCLSPAQSKHTIMRPMGVIWESRLIQVCLPSSLPLTLFSNSGQPLWNESVKQQQLNLFNPDTVCPDQWGVLTSSQKYTNMVLGTEKCVLISGVQTRSFPHTVFNYRYIKYKMMFMYTSEDTQYTTISTNWNVFLLHTSQLVPHIQVVCR